MGKNRPRIQHEDVYQRVNYLYQAAHECIKKNPQNVSLCRYYVYTLKIITRRLCLHLHPDIKRNMCKRCCVLLIPGVTSVVRTRGRRQKHTVVTCLECGTHRRYVYKPAKIAWIDREEAWEGRIVCGKSVTDGNKQSQKQNMKGQSKQMTSKQDSSTTSSENTNSSTNSKKNNNQTSSETNIKKKLDEEKPSASKQNFQDSTPQLMKEQGNFDGTVPSTSGGNQFLSNCDIRNLQEKFGAYLNENEGTGNKVEFNGPRGKAGIESSPNPNDKIEVTEERPDEYFYKMRCAQGFFPYLS